MRKTRILWTDDEIEVLKPHIIFLNEKGYEVDTCSNGNDTADLVRQNIYDVVLLDEHMPGLSGIETLRIVKEIRPELPVIMITKSEEEDIMEAAIGSQIADYLIKPVKPNQILLALKKTLDQKRLVTEQTTVDYRQEFRTISLLIDTAGTAAQWAEVYRKLVYWHCELEKSTDQEMSEILNLQENDANTAFCRFISNNYLKWMQGDVTDKPLLSPSLFTARIIPQLKPGRPLFLFLIDNLRLDQWRAISSQLLTYYRIASEELYYSILPTATQYSRNSIFAGLMPLEITRYMPQYWVSDDDDEGKNNYEEELLKQQLVRKGLKIRFSYNKINSNQDGKKAAEKLKQMFQNDLNVFVFNFVDIISHARTEMELIKDLAPDEKAYRSLTLSWFIHSSMFDLLKQLADHNVRIVFSTDHGTVRVQNPVKVVGDRNTSPNLRYKMGRNLDYNPSKVFEITNPEKAMLPKTNISSRYIFATRNDYLIYQNNFNYYAGYYKDTFQHGGISMHEMILPVAVLEPLT